MLIDERGGIHSNRYTEGEWANFVISNNEMLTFNIWNANNGPWTGARYALSTNTTSGHLAIYDTNYATDSGRLVLESHANASGLTSRSLSGPILTTASAGDITIQTTATDDIIFRTNNTDRLHLYSNGLIHMQGEWRWGNTSHKWAKDGIRFRDDWAYFNYYDEGTWTPVLDFATTGDLSVSYTTQLGRFTRIGREVRCYFNITTSSFTHGTASGALEISGLPFSGTTFSCVNGLIWGGITKASYTSVASYVYNSSVVNFQASGSGQAPATLQAADVPSGGTVTLEGVAQYYIV